MDEIERQAILQTLRKTEGDKELAARLLGIGLATLYRRLKEMELKDVPPEES
jgi:DNA-binding NtrC family response regulator